VQRTYKLSARILEFCTDEAALIPGDDPSVKTPLQERLHSWDESVRVDFNARFSSSVIHLERELKKAGVYEPVPYTLTIGAEHLMYVATVYGIGLGLLDQANRLSGASR
jgi:hypothetical protein